MEHDTIKHTRTEGSLDKVEMGISASGMGQLSMMLRDQIYTNKPLAVIRETICNAVDEHLLHKIERSVDVHIPTIEEPWFSVRDYANGLSKEDIFNIFFQYFTSTKKQDKTTAGFFGIGAKSWAAISDTVLVTSWHEGIKSVYAGVVVGEISEAHLNSQEASDEPSGIEVTINLPENKVHQIANAFDKFYRIYKYYFKLNFAAENETAENELIKDIYRGLLKEEEFSYHSGDCILHKGVVYNVPWKIGPWDKEVFFIVPDNVNIELHPSRERIQDTEKNRDVINVLFEASKDKSFEELKGNLPTEFFDRWAFSTKNRKEIKFLSSCGKSLVEMQDYYSVESDCFWFYSNDGDKFRRMKKYKSEMTEVQISSDSKIYFISQQSATLGMKRTFDTLFGEDDSYFVVTSRDPFYRIEDLKAILEEKCEGLSGVVVDKSDLLPTKAERKIKSAEVADIRYYSFNNNNFNKLNIRKDETYYWVPIICDGVLETRGANSGEIVSCSYVIGQNIIGLNRANRKNLPSNFKPAIPIIKAMRRHAHKAKDWSPQFLEEIPKDLVRYEFNFLNLKGKQVVGWPFPPKKRKVKVPQEVLIENKKTIKAANLLENDFEFYSLSLAVKQNNDKFSGQIKNRMLEMISQ